MEASTTIQKMLAGNKIIVPNYQRAYSWETPDGVSEKTTHTDVFLNDLNEYIESGTKSSYYFGHFIFKENESHFDVIDGQQRLTTIAIFLSALFKNLKLKKKISDSEKEIFEDLVKRNSTIRFATVEYDSQLFIDYVIEQTKKNKTNLETESAKRIVYAFDYFDGKLSAYSEITLIKLLETVRKSSCTTHIVNEESEAIQMFIFQNNRGKKPSNLEIIKAEFMYAVHLKAGENTEKLIDTIKNRFETIYKSISSIEYNLSEDEVLLFTLRSYFNSLYEDDPLDRISHRLNEPDAIVFITEFTQHLADNFEYLNGFFGKDERRLFQVHSLVNLGGIGLIVPFILKAYAFSLNDQNLATLCAALESLVLRHRLIGTSARLISRLNDVFVGFISQDIGFNEIIDRISYMKTANDYPFYYWNNEELKKSIQGYVDPKTAKFLLWKYENYLQSFNSSGYQPERYDSIISPELEHIAPQTPTNGESLAAGYCDYDEDFLNNYLDCLGNYLLTSKSHNCSVGNRPFIEKRNSYGRLFQQREIQELTSNSKKWTKNIINERKEKLFSFILNSI